MTISLFKQFKRISSSRSIQLPMKSEKKKYTQIAQPHNSEQSPNPRSGERKNIVTFSATSEYSISRYLFKSRANHNYVRERRKNGDLMSIRATRMTYWSFQWQMGFAISIGASIYKIATESKRRESIIFRCCLFFSSLLQFVIDKSVNSGVNIFFSSIVLMPPRKWFDLNQLLLIWDTNYGTPKPIHIFLISKIHICIFFLLFKISFSRVITEVIPTECVYADFIVPFQMLTT